MNRYQEALNNIMLQILHVKSDYIESGEAKADTDLLQELVDKATPKKPITGEDQDVRYASIYECPNCHKMFLGTGTNYCYRCGQALDWGKEDGQDN